MTDTPPQPANQNQPKPAQPIATTPANIGVKPQTAQPATPAVIGAQQKPAVAVGLPKDQTKSNRKFVIGCISAFGCSLVLFLGILFAFLAFGSTTNPIFTFLGVPPGEVVNVLITLVNLIFLILVFISFIVGIIGVFRITAAKKDDKEAKRSGSMLTFGALGIMMLLIVIWIFAYFFLSQKQTSVPKIAITTEPAITTNLTAPIAVKFDAKNAPINKTQFDILSYSWDFSDKSSVVTGVTQTHTFTDIGNFKVKLSIDLKEKSTSKEQTVDFTKDVTIMNVLANVVINASPKSGGAPLDVDFDGSKSSSVNGEITAYSWDLNGDGSYGDATDVQTKYTYDKIGVYKVSLRVTDSTGASSTGETEIEVKAPDNPVAVIAIEGVEKDSPLKVDTAYIFNGGTSTTPEGKIEKYGWEFSDGGKSNTRSATHTFKTAGDYEVTLTVTDSNKKVGSTTQKITVKSPDSAPLVGIKTTPEATNNIVEGQAPFNVIFDASGSKDSNNDIVDYAWDFDSDGKKDDTNAVTSHTFTSAGTYNVSITVTDSTNLSSKSQIVVKVNPADIKADLSADPIAGSTPLTVVFDASGSSYPSGKIVSYEWDFGDGSPKRVDIAKVTYQYTKIGTFTARVTAISSDNKRASSQSIINVRPVSLRACFDPSVLDGVAPLEVEFDPTCSTGTVVKYAWNFAGLGSSAERKPKFIFKNPGEYSVTLQVGDSQNVIDSFTKKITVTSSK